MSRVTARSNIFKSFHYNLSKDRTHVKLICGCPVFKWITQAWPEELCVILLRWRHNDHGGVSNHQPRCCLLNCLFRCRWMKNIKAPRHWPLCGEFTGPGEFPAQMASFAENVSIWWRHHVRITLTLKWRVNLPWTYGDICCQNQLFSKNETW